MIIIREKYKNFFPTEIFVISFHRRVRRDGIRNPAKTFILLEKRKRKQILLVMVLVLKRSPAFSQMIKNVD